MKSAIKLETTSLQRMGWFCFRRKERVQQKLNSSASLQWPFVIFSQQIVWISLTKWQQQWVFQFFFLNETPNTALWVNCPHHALPASPNIQRGLRYLSWLPPFCMYHLFSTGQREMSLSNPYFRCMKRESHSSFENTKFSSGDVIGTVPSATAFMDCFPWHICCCPWNPTKAREKPKENCGVTDNDTPWKSHKNPKLSHSYD